MNKICPECNGKSIFAGECLNCGYKDIDRIQKMEKLRKELSKEINKKNKSKIKNQESKLDKWIKNV